MLRRTFALVAVAGTLISSRSLAGDLDLDSDEPVAPPKAAAAAVVPRRSFTLSECLELADRNHPHLWAARARVGQAHAQLEEAKWLPFWQWSAQAGGGVAPQIGGTVLYNTSA